MALLLPASVQAAARAWLDRNDIELGETVTLNLETDHVRAAVPDLSVLDADFRRLGLSTSRQYSGGSGRSSFQTLVAVALEPRHAGVLGIPSLEIGNELTDPLTVTVRPGGQGLRGPASSSAAGDDLVVEVDVDQASPYVQQQVILRIRLMYADLAVTDGTLEEPQGTGIRLQQLGDDASFRMERDGRVYNVVERRFALSADSSGPLELAPARFEGRALSGGRFGGLLGASRRVTAASEPLQLNIRPAPAGASQPFLPAKDLSISLKSPALPPAVAVGTPLSIEIEVRARGLTPEQMPRPNLPAVAGADVYPEEAVVTARGDRTALEATLTRAFAVVPKTPGTMTIPPIEIAWWDLAADQPRIAQLPARTVVVNAVGGAGGAEPSSLAGGPDDAPTMQPSATGLLTPPSLGHWPRAALLSVFALALLSAALLALYLVERRRPGTSRTAKSPDPRAGSNAKAAANSLADFKRALRDAPSGAMLAKALVRLAQNRPDASRDCAKSLGAVAALLADSRQRAAVEGLERSLYAPSDTDLEAQAVARMRDSFRHGPAWIPRDRTSKPDQADGLPELYPDKR